MNADRPILSAAMILVSGNIRCMVADIRGDSSGRAVSGSQDQILIYITAKK